MLYEEDPRIDDLRANGATIGKGVYLGSDVYIEQVFGSLLLIEDDVVLARGVNILLHDSALNNVANEPLRFGQVILRKRCYIGANSTILCGVEIGAGAVIGAGSLVSRSVPPGVVAYGHPARIYETVRELAERHRRLQYSDQTFLYINQVPWRDRIDPSQTNQELQTALQKWVTERQQGNNHISRSILQDSITMTDSTLLLGDSLPSAELEHILQRIDENLALRPLFQHQSEMNHGVDQPSSIPLSLPPIPDWAGRIGTLRYSQAPLFRVDGNGLGNQVRRLLNIPIKALGYKQIGYNQELINFLDEFTAQIIALRQQTEYNQQQVQMAQKTTTAFHQLSSRVDEIELQLKQTLAQLDKTQEIFDTHQSGLTAITESVEVQNTRLQALAEQSQGQNTWLQALAEQSQGQNTWLQALAEQSQGQNTWLNEVAAAQQGMHDWINIISRKTEMLALDVREQKEEQFDSTLPEPSIPNPEHYAERLVSFGENIRINLGCGEKIEPDYLNIDSRPMPEVDVIADVRRLPFELGSLAEIMSSHLVEHFREHQMKVTILPYWKSLLLTGGMLRIICPNWEEMLEQLQQGKMSLSVFKKITFGAQDYVGDDHFAMYTPTTLTTLLESVGFGNIQVLTTDRMNGLCPEMELTATI